MITEREVISSQFKKVKYDSESKILTITFNNDKRYEYKDVPQSTFDSLMSADSLGSYFGKHIKGHFDYRPL